MIPTQQELRCLFHYDPETGVVTRLTTTGRHGRWAAGIRAGSIANIVSRSGGLNHYRMISIDGKARYEHRLIWLYVTGEWPKHKIDHINGDGLDNRWCNLRKASDTENAQNKRLYKSNKSGHKGVRWNAERHIWQSLITHNKKQRYLGSFVRLEDAAKAYETAAKKYHGKFARVA